MGDTAGAAVTEPCATDNPQLFYTVSIPASSRANFTLTRGIGAIDLRARVVGTCGARSCPQFFSTASASTFSLTNITAAPSTAVLAVSSTSTTPGTFTLAYTGSGPLPTNVSCAAPATLAPGSMVTVDTNIVGGPAVGCETSFGGRVLYYSVSVPAASAVSVALTRTGTNNAFLRVVDSCAATECYAAVDARSATAATTLLENPSMAPRTFILSVGSASAMTSVTATLAAAAPTMLSYVQSTTPAMCDSMAMGAPVTVGGANLTGDLATSARATLPFSLSFFGAAVNEYSVTTSGIAQLWTMGSAGTPTSEFVNVPIGSSANPNNFVAPFWDYLRFEGPNTARTVTLGAAPNRRFVIEWTDILNLAAMRASMRFQAKLFEGTNIIEFHYCALSAPMNPFSTGGDATIGLEGPTGLQGSRRAFKSPNAINLTDAIRFTPRP